jgi:hypothetical protein
MKHAAYVAIIGEAENAWGKTGFVGYQDLEHFYFCCTTRHKTVSVSFYLVSRMLVAQWTLSEHNMTDICCTNKGKIRRWLVIFAKLIHRYNWGVSDCSDIARWFSIAPWPSMITVCTVITNVANYSAAHFKWINIYKQRLVEQVFSGISGHYLNICPT